MGSPQGLLLCSVEDSILGFSHQLRGDPGTALGMGSVPSYASSFQSPQQRTFQPLDAGNQSRSLPKFNTKEKKQK
jgi:hypothetical protein